MQTETVTPSGTKTMQQMQDYDKTHPPSTEKRVIPIMPGPGSQDIDAGSHSGGNQTGK